MGVCPCFGKETKKKGGSVIMMNKEPDTNCEEALPSATATSSPPVKLTSTLEPRLKCSISLDSSACKNSKPTFSYRELAGATNNFRSECLIGEGGFGSVYIGKLQRTGQVVAVKKLDISGVQGSKEFLVEVLMLSLLHHPNLVDLVGFCAEGEQRLLVYEYLPLGSLEYHLHDLPPDAQALDWNSRMKIAAGIAEGLHYLHNEADPPVIHRDLKSSNVLLDEGFHPKLSDFGLAKFGPPEDKSHVSTRIMGTEGYCAPEYFDTGKLTAKSDIFCFGILLLEIISGRRAKDISREQGKRTLLQWAHPFLEDPKNFGKIVDERLEGQFSNSGLHLALDVALRCIQETPRLRPSTGDIVSAMKFLTNKRVAAARGSGDDEVRDEMEACREANNISDLGAAGGHEAKSKSERARAVADAKLWGESWRSKKQLCSETEIDKSSV